MAKRTSSQIVIPVSDFGARLNALKRLQQQAGRAYRNAVAAILAFAREYNDLYENVRRNPALVSKLNDELGLEEWQATRWRGIASQETTLKSIQKSLPPAFEPIYEVARILKRDEKRVLKAVENETLTPSSKMRDIRDIRKKRASRPRATSAFRLSTAQKVTAKELSSIELTFVVPLAAVPRWERVKELRDGIERLLAKYRARCVGLASVTDGEQRRNEAAEILQQHLEMYWLFKDEAVALKQSGTAEEKADLERRWNTFFEEGQVWS